MKSQTISVFIAAPPAQVYAFASNPENLPRWVPSFFNSVERVNGEWVAQTPLGRALFEFVPPNDLGVLDHTITLSSGIRLTNPMRVIPNGDGSEMLLTLIQAEDVPDEQFKEDGEQVLSDLHSLRRLLEAPGAPPAGVNRPQTGQ
jgi:hypothetical protein